MIQLDLYFQLYMTNTVIIELLKIYLYIDNIFLLNTYLLSKKPYIRNLLNQNNNFFIIPYINYRT